MSKSLVTILCIQVQVGHTFCHVSRDQQTMTEKNDFVDMVDRLEYDEMEYRAIQAEVCTRCVLIGNIVYDET